MKEKKKFAKITNNHSQQTSPIILNDLSQFIITMNINN